MANSEAEQLIQKLLHNQLTMSELEAFLAGLSDETLQSEYSRLLSEYFDALLGGNKISQPFPSSGK